MSASPVEEILSRKLVRTVYHLIEKILNEPAILLHITDIHMTCDQFALRRDIRKQRIDLRLQIRIRDRACQCELKRSVTFNRLCRLRHLTNLTDVIDFYIHSISSPCRDLIRNIRSHFLHRLDKIIV